MPRRTHPRPKPRPPYLPPEPPPTPDTLARRLVTRGICTSAILGTENHSTPPSKETNHDHDEEH